MKYFFVVLIFILLIPLPVLAGDEIQINKQIQAGNGTITLASKNYIIENPILLKSNIVLQGNGKVTFTLKPYVKWALWVPVMSVTSLKNIRVTGINFNMNSDSQTVQPGLGYHNGIYFDYCTNVELDHCSFVNGKGDGARFKSSSNLNIHDNTAKRLGHDCIFVVDCNNVTMTNNQVSTRTNSGLRDWNTVNLIIKNKTITSQQDGNGGYAGIQIEYSKYFDNPNVQICNNVITRTQGPGVQLINYDDGLSIKKGITVEKNQFIQTGLSTYIVDAGGISIMGSKGAIIQNNVLDGCYNAGVIIMSGGEGMVIKNNIITNTLPHIMRTQTGTGVGILNRASTSFLIDSNCFWNNQNGNLYRCSAKNSDLKDPKIHKTTSGWIWKAGKMVSSLN